MNLRPRLRLALWAPAVFLLLVDAMCALNAAGLQRVYLGTYTGPQSRGIYLAQFDPDTGNLSAPELVAETKNPSFLALHPSRPFLYAVGEVDQFEGKPSGAVSAFEIDDKTGGLTLLNRQTSGGTGPCHLALDRTGKCVLVANYSSGSVAALPIGADGRLGPLATTLPHHGSGSNPERQAGPHAHFVTMDPANRIALVCDLGLDKVFLYRLEPAQARLTPNVPPFVSVAAGFGPRHLAFHPNGRFVYLVNEMASTLTVLSYDAASGSLHELQTLPTQSEPAKAENLGAEIQVHPSGRFVYASNRGHDSIAVFAADSRSGRLSFIGCQPSGGKTPRHFTLAPDGRWLLVENQDSNEIVVFRVDSKTGKLTFSGHEVKLGSPVCAVFARAD